MKASSRPTAQHHLVTVWNPSYAVNAMEQHLAVLLDLADHVDRDALSEDALYVWWGKVRSPNRQAPQAHLDELRAVAREIADGTRDETQLYLTDYQSLYVGDVDGIVEGDLPPRERRHVPAYYAAGDLSCDFWFRLRDIRRLVTDDMRAVIEELKQLRNVHYHDRPVSLFGGMVDLPLFVTRPDGKRFFDEAEREAQTDGALWAEFDAESGAGVAAMERDLRENLLGEAAWNALEPTTRVFIATAEKLLREHRTDPAFDFGPVMTSFSKALEVQVNAVLRRALVKVPPSSRRVNLDGRTVDIAEQRALGLGQLVSAIARERDLNAALTSALVHGAWFTGSLPAILDDFRGARNEGTHESRVDRATAERWRNRLLGVGCAGDFVELAKVKVK